MENEAILRLLKNDNFGASRYTKHLALGAARRGACSVRLLATTRTRMRSMCGPRIDQSHEMMAGVQRGPYSNEKPLGDVLLLLLLLPLA